MSDSPSLRSLVDDTQNISNSDSVLRVVSPQFITDGEIQSRAFQDQSAAVAAQWALAGPCASVNLRSIWEAEGADLNALLASFHPGSGIAEVPVGSLRNLVNSIGEPIPQGLMLDPRPGAPWHAVMFAQAGSTRSKGAMRALVEASSWFYFPGQ